MKHRSPLAVFFLPIITLGIYGLVWEVKTKNEMNQLGANIPTAWLLIIPFVSLYWLWKYSEGVEQATGGKTSGVLAFVLLFLLGTIGMAILQNEFNKLGDAVATQLSGAATQPDNSFGGPVQPGAPVPPAGMPAPPAAMPAPAPPAGQAAPATPPSDSASPMPPEVHVG